MTAGPSIEPARFLHEQLTHASPDLLRDLLSTFIDALMSAEADAICGAEYGARSTERANTRNGYRHRDFDTRVGTMDVAIPKLRAGTYFPDWLLERRRRARQGTQAPKKVEGRMPIRVANDRTTSSGTLVPVSEPDAST